MSRILALAVALPCIVALLSGCHADEEAAQQMVRNSLVIKDELEFRKVRTMPGDVVCGEFSAYLSYTNPKQEFAPFYTLDGQLNRSPSPEQLAIYCNEDPAAGLQQLTGSTRFTADNAALARITADLGALADALTRYYRDNDRYPDAEQGLVALVTKPATGHLPRVYPEGGYLPALPADPWGKPYIYSVVQWAGARGEYSVASLGADGAPGGTGDNADLSTQYLPYLQHVARILGLR